VLVSSVTGSGIENLLSKLEARFGGTADQYEVTLKPEDGKGLAWFHERAEVLTRRDMKSGNVKLRLRMNEDRAGQAKSAYGKALKKVKG
jgi:GTPase